MSFCKKNICLFVVIFVCKINFCFSSEGVSLCNQALSGLSIGFDYTNAFNLYNMDKYSKNAIGGKLCLEYTFLPDVAKKFDLGLYTRSAFYDFIPYNFQLISLYSVSFSGGFFAQWNIPKDFSINFGCGAGFLISQIDFVSAEKGNVSDVYYDFMFEADLSLRKSILNTKIFNLEAGAGCHLAFYNEKSENFMNIGPFFGILFNFNPLRMR